MLTQITLPPNYSLYGACFPDMPRHMLPRITTTRCIFIAIINYYYILICLLQRLAAVPKMATRMIKSYAYPLILALKEPENWLLQYEYISRTQWAYPERPAGAEGSMEYERKLKVVQHHFLTSIDPPFKQTRRIDEPHPCIPPKNMEMLLFIK